MFWLSAAIWLQSICQEGGGEVRVVVLVGALGDLGLKAVVGVEAAHVHR